MPTERLPVVMPSNMNTLARRVDALHPGRVALLFSPFATNDDPVLPYALDNGRFPCWARGAPWCEDRYRRFLARMAVRPAAPLWCLAPDVVADRVATLKSWAKWAPWLKDTYGWRLAVAVQDGMVPSDVRKLDPAPEVVFVGGTTRFKWRTLESWCGEFPRVHVGRVNSYGLLWSAHEAGAESTDGTGWWHHTKVRKLLNYLDRSGRGLGRDDRRRITPRVNLA